MKILFTLLTAVIALLGLGCATSSPNAQQSTKRVSFDQFFAGQIVSLPLALNIPKDYVHAEGLDAGATYSYWMLQEEVGRAARTKDLPRDTGYVYGKISMSVGYDQRAGKFSSEDQMDAQFAQQGVKIIEKKRFKTKGYPVLSYIVRMNNGTVVCQMYVGTLVSTNAVYIAYRPPNDDLKLGVEVWHKILEPLERQDD